MENSKTIKAEDYNSLSVGKLVESSVISPFLSINSFFWTEVLEAFDMLKKEREVYDIIDNIMEERNVTEENKTNCNKEESIKSVDTEPEVSEPFEKSIPDHEPLYENVSQCVEILSKAVEESISNQEATTVTTDVPKPSEAPIPDQEPLKEAYEPIVNADLVPENGDLDKDTVPIHLIESQSLDSCVDALTVVLPENDEEKIKFATLPMPTVKCSEIT